MAKKEYFLYGGLFLAGAILTPAAVGLFGQGDRPAETTETAANETFGNGDSEPSFMADEPTTATFAENDSREQILKDYETVSPEALRNIPTAIPSTPPTSLPCRPIPTIGRISEFQTSPVRPSTPIPVRVNPVGKQQAIAPLTMSPAYRPSIRKHPQTLFSLTQQRPPRRILISRAKTRSKPQALSISGIL